MGVIHSQVKRRGRPECAKCSRTGEKEGKFCTALRVESQSMEVLVRAINQWQQITDAVFAGRMIRRLPRLSDVVLCMTASKARVNPVRLPGNWLILGSLGMCNFESPDGKDSRPEEP